MAGSFAAAMRLMRKHDPQLQEDGFQQLRALGADVLPVLVEAYGTETDHGVKCWLLELIGDARSESALNLLIQELGNDDEALHDWARRGLERLGTKEARTALWEDQQTRSGLLRGSVTPDLWRREASQRRPRRTS